MKKLGIVLAALAVIGLSGCATREVIPPAEPLTVDLSLLPQVRNEASLLGQVGATGATGTWVDFKILLPEFPGVDFRAFSRVTIRADYFDADGNLIYPDNDLVMVTLVYDPAGDLRGPPDGPGRNTPLKQFNLGGDWGSVHTYRGSLVRLTQAPGAVLFQNTTTRAVAYIEITELTFHNR